MASISSMISFFVLLLVTYSYAAPFVPEGTTTGEYEVINATVIVETDSTVVPVTSIHIKSRSKSQFQNSTSSEESDSNENVSTTATDLIESSTVVEDSSSIVMIPKRGIDVDSFTDANEKRGVEESSDSTVTGLYESSTDVEDSSSIVMIPKRFTAVDSFTDANEKRSIEESSDSTVTDLNESSTDVEDSSSIVMIPKRGMNGVFTDATETTEERDIEDTSSTGINDKRGVEESSTDFYESSTVEDSSSIVMIPKRGMDVDSFTDANEKRGVEESSDSTVTGLYESSTDVEDSSSIVMIPKRGMDGVFTDATETTEERDIEDSTGMNDKRDMEDSTGMNDKRTVEDFLFTTIESSTEFNSRVIRPVQIVEEKIESSTIVSSDYQPEMTTDLQPSSSVDSFVKFTGLLHEQPSTTFEYETTSQVEEESTTELPVPSETATKILSIIPGTISETKIVINRPTETPVVIQRVDQKQLSQVGNQSIIEETKSDN